MSDLEKILLEVEATVRATGTIDKAEEMIDSNPDLSDDERAALWLFCWSLIPVQQQRTTALMHLKLVTAGRD